MKKRILIFGGGENQLTLIKAAKILSVESVVIDPNADAPGKVTADYFEVVGPADYELTKEIALKYKVSGIVTSQMENPLMLMAQLADELGYIFPSKNVILQCRNKYSMKQVFLKNAIPCAKYILLKPDENITPDILKDFSFPLVIKPVDAHSSRGVYRINDYVEIESYEKNTRGFSSDGSLLIEEFITGKEYSVESMTYKGKTSIIQITEKIITPFPYTVELGHIQPAELKENEKRDIEIIVTKAIKALGIDNTATHAELKINHEGPFIIEIGARLGGDYISSYLTLASTGVNMDEGAIKIALGHKPNTTHTSNNYAYIKYLELPVGKVVAKIKNWEHIKSYPNTVYAATSLFIGQKIPPITDSAKRPGFIIVKGESRTEVINEANKLAGTFKSCVVCN